MSVFIAFCSCYYGICTLQQLGRRFGRLRNRGRQLQHPKQWKWRLQNKCTIMLRVQYLWTSQNSFILFLFSKKTQSLTGRGGELRWFPFPTCGVVILGVHEVFPLELVRRGFIVHDGGVRDLKWEISGQVMLNNYVVAIIRKAVKQYLIGTKPGMNF